MATKQQIFFNSADSLTVKQVAALLRLHPKTIAKYIRSGKLAAVKRNLLGRQVYSIQIKNLDELLSVLK